MLETPVSLAFLWELPNTHTFNDFLKTSVHVATQDIFSLVQMCNFRQGSSASKVHLLKLNASSSCVFTDL